MYNMMHNLKGEPALPLMRHPSTRTDQPHLKPQSAALEAIAKSGTKTVYLPSIPAGFPKRYVYGKTPELYAAQLNGDMFNPQGRTIAFAAARDGKEILTTLPAEMSRYALAGGDEVWQLCRLLRNPKRLELLTRLYRDYRDPSLDGFTVGAAQDRALLKMSATSEYLKSLESIGVIRRRRIGRYTCYYPDTLRAKPAIREIATHMRQRLLQRSNDMSYVAILGVMGHALRASIINRLAVTGRQSLSQISEWTHKPPRALARDLKPAQIIGLLYCDTDDFDRTYACRIPADPVAQLIIALAR